MPTSPLSSCLLYFPVISSPLLFFLLLPFLSISFVSAPPNLVFAISPLLSPLEPLPVSLPFSPLLFSLLLPCLSLSLVSTLLKLFFPAFFHVSSQPFAIPFLNCYLLLLFSLYLPALTTSSPCLLSTFFSAFSFPPHLLYLPSTFFSFLSFIVISFFSLYIFSSPCILLLPLSFVYILLRLFFHSSPPLAPLNPFPIPLLQCYLLLLPVHLLQPLLPSSLLVFSLHFSQPFLSLLTPSISPQPFSHSSPSLLSPSFFSSPALALSFFL